MTLYDETRHRYQQSRKHDTICQLLTHCAIFPSPGTPVSSSNKTNITEILLKGV